MTYPAVGGLHYGPALAVTLWTQAGSIPGDQDRAGSVVLGSVIDVPEVTSGVLLVDY